MRRHLRPGCIVPCLLMVVPLTPAHAELTCADLYAHSAGSALSTPRQIEVERVGARDLTGAFGRSRTIAHRNGLIGAPPSVHRIVRRVPNLWRRKIPASMSPLALRVSYRLLVNGRSSRDAQHVDAAERRLPVTIIPMQPIALCKSGGQQLVQGGVIIEFSSVGLPTAGRYRIDIEPTVTLP